MATDEASLGKGVFSEDYMHFEQNHADFPMEAQSVFHSVTELRSALSAFRKATENACVVDDEISVANVLPAEVDASVDILLAEASLGSPSSVADIQVLDG
jgi:hypothetical protein